MGAFSDLIAYIVSVVKANNNEEITGTNMQSVLLDMVGDLGGSQFGGVATPTFDPGTPQNNIFYFATELGAYQYFGVLLENPGLYVLKYDHTATEWQVYFIDVYGTVVSDVYSEEHPLFPIETIKVVKNGTTSDVTTVLKPNGVVAGGIVTWLTGLEFLVEAIAYFIAGIFYSVGSNRITLDAADPTYPRLDLICVDSTPQIVILKGVPAENPQLPTPSTSQLALTSILIPAGSSTPGGTIIGDLIYDENVEWVVTSSGVTVDPNSTVSPLHGTKCIEVGTIGNTDTITFTRSEPIEIAQFDKYSQNIKLKSVLNKQYRMTVQLLLAGSPVSKEVTLTFDYSSVDWQHIPLLLSLIPSSSTTIDGVRLKWIKSGAATEYQGFYLDFIKLEAGIEPPPNTDGWYLDADTNFGFSRTTIKDGDNVYFIGTNGLIIKRYSHITKGNVIELELPTLASAYVYIAYATDITGTDFTLINNPAYDYTAILSSSTELTNPVVGDFAGLWFKRRGEAGLDGNTPYIGVNLNWWIAGEDTGILAQGTDGDDGVGVPIGGLADQVLRKDSNDDYDASWGYDDIIIHAIAVNLTARGLKVYVTANENQVFGNVCYINATGKAQKADKSAVATSYASLICIGTVAANGSGLYLKNGYIRNDAWNWDVRLPVYLDTAGGMTQTAPSTVGHVAQVLAIPVSATVLDFSPSLSQVVYK